MSGQPSLQLISFYKAHGRRGATTSARATAYRDFFMAGARAMAEQAVSRCNSPQACITAVDDIAAACIGALAAGHGLELNDDPSVLHEAEALDVLFAELDLDPRAAMPLHELRRRAREIKRGVPEDCSRPDEVSDRYLAHHGGNIGESLVEWTAERLRDVSVH